MRVLDDDFEISVSPSSIRENADATDVEITVNAGLGADISAAVEIGLTEGDDTGTANTDLETTSEATASVTVMADEETGMRSGVDTVSVDATDDATQDELNEAINVAATTPSSAEQGVYVKPAMIMILDDDPDFTLTADMTEIDEDAGTVTVELTATTTEAVGGIVNFELALGGTATRGAANTDDYNGPATVTLQIDGGGTSATATVTLTIVDDAADDDDETITVRRRRRCCSGRRQDVHDRERDGDDQRQRRLVDSNGL